MAPHIEPYLIHADSKVCISNDDWIVVVSHTCDIMAQKIEAEPFVEVLHCKPIAKLRPQYKDLRSTRILDFKPNRETHGTIVLSAHAVKDRYIFPRQLLCNHKPDAERHLSKIATTRILAWYALRYSRPAWPDAFCARIGQVRDRLKEILEPLKDDIAEVRISIVEKGDKLQNENVYHVAIFFVVDEAIWESNFDGRRTINASFAKFVAEIRSCEGIEVNDEVSGVISGAEFSWQATKSSDEWNFANLTHRDLDGMGS